MKLKRVEISGGKAILIILVTFFIIVAVTGILTFFFLQPTPEEQQNNNRFEEYRVNNPTPTYAIGNFTINTSHPEYITMYNEDLTQIKENERVYIRSCEIRNFGFKINEEGMKKFDSVCIDIGDSTSLRIQGSTLQEAGITYEYANAHFDGYDGCYELNNNNEFHVGIELLCGVWRDVDDVQILLVKTPYCSYFENNTDWQERHPECFE